MQIVERAVGDVAVLDLDGRLIAGDGDQQLVEAVNRITQAGRRKVLLNLAAVNYIDSAGLGAIVSKFITLRKRDGHLKLCNLRVRAFRVLNITRLLTVLESFESEAEAVQSFADQGSSAQGTSGVRS